ncbi:hypothetical protein IMZ48_27550 [Candidatus Bathyarchaeota archaeon]|nr:hypothetical protein [Candidatus Bathyarchaeota archaeon]
MKECSQATVIQVRWNLAAWSREGPSELPLPWRRRPVAWEEATDSMR